MSLFNWDTAIASVAGIEADSLNVVSKLLSKSGRVNLPKGYDRIGPREMASMLATKALEKIHRVEFTQNKICVLSLGLEAENHEKEYESSDELPEWMQNRLSVLMMMSYEPPTKYVDGVGRRIDERVFWVVEP